jgi:hypothetical protein
MRVILMGCEYVGKTTLAHQIVDLITGTMGDTLPMHQFGWHDHFVLPFESASIGEADADADQIMAMSPSLLEKFSRYLIAYHFGQSFTRGDHHLLTNWYYGDAVYAPIYYGYGGRGEFADRQRTARQLDAEVMETMPDMVLVLMKASPDEIRRRMAAGPHKHSFLRAEDVESVLQRFDEEYADSLIRRKFTIDTSDMTPEQTFDTFMRGIRPHLNVRDRLVLQGSAYLME